MNSRAKKQRAQRIIGIVLLVALLVPVIVMLRPVTYIDYFPVYAEYAYIPLVELLRTVDGTPDDVSFLATYAGIFTLAIWLMMRRSTRHRLKEG